MIIPVLVEEMKPRKTTTEIQQLCAEVVAHILKHLYLHNESNIGSKAINLIYSSNISSNCLYKYSVKPC